tara:strand:- start:66 stop:443 length:378 start_codon:yes stop_codon:yes gene_type:complete
MVTKLLRISIIILSFFFLTGFMPIISFVGPGVTALTSGNIYKASAQYFINKKIEEETGKNSFTLVKTFIEDKPNKKDLFEDDLRHLVEIRIKMTRKKLNDQNFQKLVKKRIEITRTQLNLSNINQ